MADGFMAGSYMVESRERIGKVPIEDRPPIDVRMGESHGQMEVGLYWPTDLSDERLVAHIQEVIGSRPDTAGWETEIVWGERVGSIDEYLQAGKPDSFLLRLDPSGEPSVTWLSFRLNCGPHVGEGFSVTLLGEPWEPLLLGDFSLEDGDLANAIVESTIAPEGRGKTAEIAALALAYS